MPSFEIDNCDTGRRPYSVKRLLVKAQFKNYHSDYRGDVKYTQTSTTATTPNIIQLSGNSESLRQRI